MDKLAAGTSLLGSNASNSCSKNVQGSEGMCMMRTPAGILFLGFSLKKSNHVCEGGEGEGGGSEGERGGSEGRMGE